jgi:hypothetical protein
VAVDERFAAAEGAGAVALSARSIRS